MSHIVKDGAGSLKYVFSIGTGTIDDPYRVVAQSYERAIVDAGKAFIHSDRHSVANNDTLYYLLKTPASPAHVELLQLVVSTTSSPLEYSISEECIVSANGTSEVLFNMNRQSTTSAGTLLYMSPTVTDVGTYLIESVVSGDKSIGSQGAQVADDYRFILKASTNYLISVHNVSGATASVGLTVMMGED